MSSQEVLESEAKQMSDEQIRSFLTAEGVGTLALSDEGVPYAVPMSFGYDGDSALYFLFLLFGTESRKERLSDRADRARFLVYHAESMHDWRSVSLVGEIEAVEDDCWDELQTAMENAWHPNLFSSASPMRGVRGYRFRIANWTGIHQAV
jgi:nitroimidazol reductase NimA-like FMN-containing flavoprotein (pyridoxamine 5'-phosphate oxidase superfamily)